MRHWWTWVLGLLVIGVAVLFWSRSRPVAVTPATSRDEPQPAPTPPAALRLRGHLPVQRGVLADAPTPKPCLRGRVVDVATNAVLPGAQVVLSTTRGVVQAATGPQGTFEFLLEEAGSVEVVEVGAPGYFPYRPPWGTSPIHATLAAGRCVTELTLSLARRVSYDGLVRSKDGKPVAGARVSIASMDEPPEPALTTSAEGAFRFEAKDSAVLLVAHPAFEPKAVSVDFRVGVSGKVVVVLAPRSTDAGVERATLKGKVVDEREAVVPGAHVAATQRFDDGARLEGHAESSSDGTFTIPVEGPGPWRLAARLESSVSPTVVTAGEPVVLRLRQGSELRGVVQDASGARVQSFTVMVSRRDGPVALQDEQVRHFVDAQGAFTWKGLPGGSAIVVGVAALGFASSEPVDVTIEPGRATSVSFTLRRGGRVVGRVVERGTQAPLAGARVSLEGRNEGAMVALPAARSASDGSFLLPNVKPGRRSLFVAAEGHHARLLTVEVPDEAAADPLTVDLGTLEKDEEPRIELVGIGAVLEAKGDALVIKEAMAGAGAALAGLGPGDGILSIDGAPAQTLGFGGAIERIRGEEGTTLELEVRRVDGSVQRLTVTRRRVAK